MALRARFRTPLVALVIGSLLAVSLAADAAPIKCVSGKGKCVRKKLHGILNCEITAIKTGLATDPACVLKARQKFDGGLLVPPVPEKGCFERLENRDDDGPGPVFAERDCLTFDDTTLLEAQVDGFESYLVAQLDPDDVAIANKCVAGKIRCALKTTEGLLKCNEKASPEGVGLDPECLAKVSAKLDGSLLVPPAPEKGCFAKLEAKDETGPGAVVDENDCSTFDDRATIQNTIDDFIITALCALGYRTVGLSTIGFCDPTPSPTPTP